MAYRLVLPFADVGLGVTAANGATLAFFDQGTSTPKEVFSNFALSTSAGTSVQADATGLFPSIFLDTEADVTLTDGNGVQQWGPITVYAPDDSIAALAASQITVADIAGYYTETNVESVLGEITFNLASINPGQGASKIGVEDSGGLLTAATVEAALAELAAAQATEEYKVKTALQSKTDDTFVDDDHLTGFTHTDGRVYEITGYLPFTQDVGDIKLQFVFNVTPVDSKVTYTAVDSSSASFLDCVTPMSDPVSITTLTDGLESSISINGYFISNGGTLKLQWAQNTTNFTSTTLQAGGWIKIKDIGSE